MQRETTSSGRRFFIESSAWAGSRRERSFRNRHQHRRSTPAGTGSLTLRNSWLLLGEAVESAEAPDEFAAIDRDDLAGGEGLVERGDGPGIVLAAIDRKEDGGVRDIEICVARGEALALAFHAGWHGERENMKRLAARKSHDVESVEVALEGLEIWVVLVFFDGGDDGGRADEPGDVIDMAIRVVALDAVAEPEDGFHPECVAEFFFNCSAIF